MIVSLQVGVLRVSRDLSKEAVKEIEGKLKDLASVLAIYQDDAVEIIERQIK